MKNPKSVTGRRWLVVGSAALATFAAGCAQTPPLSSWVADPVPQATGVPPGGVEVAHAPGAVKVAFPAAPTRVAASPPAVTAPAAAEASLPRATRRADFGRVRPAADARRIGDWIVDSRDHGDLPFIIVDKVHAKVYAFDAEGRLRGASAALLGSARGDDSVPGIGERKIADIRPHERTTPAGRFVAEMGENASGEDILWVEYDTAVSMHRVRANNRAERRLQRLASATAADNRISYGCINLPVAFYENVVKRLFAARDGIVYVLPETRPALAFFSAYEVVRTAGR